MEAGNSELGLVLLKSYSMKTEQKSNEKRVSGVPVSDKILTDETTTLAAVPGL